MLTVPAQIFCAPTRARLMATLRSIPGVCGVLGSSEDPGITRTPSCFHLAMVYCSVDSLPPTSGAGEAARFLGGAEQRLGLVHAFLLFRSWNGVGYDAGAGLDV